MNAIFKSSFGTMGRRTIVLAICLALAALGLSAIPVHKALAANTVSSAVYQDTNNDGLIDKIVWTMDENVLTCPFESGDWTIPQAGTVQIASVTGLTCTGANAILNILVTSSAVTPTTGGGTNPTLTYTDQGSTHVTLTSGAMTNKVAQAATDNAAPVLISVTKSLVSSANVLTFTYSENMAVSCSGGASTATCGDITTAGTVAGFGSFATTGDVTVPTTKNTVGGTGTPNITVTLASQAAGYMNSASTTEPNAVFTPVQSAGAEVHESAAGAQKVNTSYTGVVTATPSGNTTWDLTKPTITSVTLADAAGNNGKVDQATVVFSSTIRDASITNADALLGGGGHTGTFTTGTANDNTTTFNLTADTLVVNTAINAANLNYTGATTKITDLAGNLLSTTTPGTIVDADNTGKLVDGANPIVVSVTVDNAAVAGRNTVVLVYSEPVTLTCNAGHSTAGCGDLTTPGTLTGMGSFATGSGAGGASVPTGLNTVAGSTTNTVTITLADQAGGYITNGSTLSVSGVFTPVAAAGVVDAASLQVNIAATPTTTVTHAWTLTQPTITSVTLNDNKAGAHNGRVDIATVVFSASVRDANITDANAALGGGAGTFATGAANDNTTVFTITSDVLPIDTSATAAQFTYSGATTKITDLFGNLLNTATPGTIVAADIVETDGANPVIASTTPTAGATSISTSATVVVTFSEPMNGPGTACTFISAPDPTGYANIQTAGNWSNGNKTVTLIHTANYAINTLVTLTVGGCTAAVAPAALVTNSATANPWTFTTVASGSSAGGGGNATTPASINVTIPNGGSTYTAGQQIGISWTSGNGNFVTFKISYSSDNGNTWAALSTTSNSSYTWAVPTTSTTQGLIKVEGLDSTGTVLASDVSDAVFTVAGTTVAPPAVTPPANTPPPQNDDTVKGVYDSNTAKQNNPTFNTDMNIQTAAAPLCVSGSLIKGKVLPAVYYCGADGKRYVFVNDKAYFSWYPDFSTVKVVTDATLASITIGGNITYRPGTRMLKIQSDPKTYVVARGGILRWVETEAAAIRLFGATWNQQIDDVSDSFFVNYKLGDPIAQ